MSSRFRVPGRLILIHPCHGRWYRELLLLLVVSLLITLMEQARAADNPIVIENRQPGSDGWELKLKPADDSIGQIKGYASATSVEKGKSIDFKVTVNPAQSYTIEVFRLGWYQGLGGRDLMRVGPLDGIKQPSCPTDVRTGLIVCNWQVSYTLNVPASWTSGIYVALLTNAQHYSSYIIFVVRDDTRTASLLYQQSVTTYQAYNNYPDNNTSGKSLYEYNSYGMNTVARTKRAIKVSFDRPYADGNGVGNFFAWEIYFVRWLEREGYDVSYSTDVDTHANTKQLTRYKAFLSVGHDEYWSKEMRDAVEAARDAGVNLAFFGADDAFWQVRFEASGNNSPHRIMICYKNAALDPVRGPTTTVEWRNAPVNRPEQAMIGLKSNSQVKNNKYVHYVVNNSGHWVYAGTRFNNGDKVAGIVGYETDRHSTSDPKPNHQSDSFQLLSKSPYTNFDGKRDFANSSIYQAPSGAWVFAAGTIGWSLALDNYGTHRLADTRIQRTTANVLQKFLHGRSE